MSETLAACLTPPGTAAIAVIGVRGPRAISAVEECFRSGGERETAKRGCGALEVGKVLLGKFGGDTRDDIVLLIQQIEPVPAVEIHCHGGREVVRLILETLATHGIRPCSWEEWERQSPTPPLRAEATLQLARAPTVRTASILLDQYHGAFEREVEAILAALDQDPAEARQRLQALAERIPLGRHLVQPWRVVVAGAPNVGKSSLVNALAGYQRSIVAPTVGTTRDVVTIRIALDGWPIELVDTAGLRSGAGELEAAGIRLAQDMLGSADLRLWVVEGSATPTWPSDGLDYLLVINKIDLPAAWDLGLTTGAATLSALTGQGIPDLCQALVHRLVPRPPPPTAGVPFTDSLGKRIAQALECLRSGRVAECRQGLAALLSGSA